MSVEIINHYHTGLLVKVSETSYYYFCFSHSSNFQPDQINVVARKALYDFLDEERSGRDNYRPNGINWSDVWEEVPRKYWKRQGLELVRASWLEATNPEEIKVELDRLNQVNVVSINVSQNVIKPA